MPPAWLTVISWIAIAGAVLSATWIAYDIYGRKHRQQMGVMEAVWPITALYFGPLAVWGYRRFGLEKSPSWRLTHGIGEAPEPPHWAVTAMGVSHCGAGCAIGDLMAEWVVFGLGLTIGGLALIPEYIGDYLAAVTLGILFQYFAIAPMRGLSLGKGLVQATKADVLSLTAFEVGLFGWMAIMRFVLFPGPLLRPDHVAYWFLMQIGMIIGFATSWPANIWLIRKGIKEAM